MGNVDFLEFCQHPDILSMVEQLIGPDIIQWSNQLFAKPPADGKAVPWHQNGAYWPIEPLAKVGRPLVSRICEIISSGPLSNELLVRAYAIAVTSAVRSYRSPLGKWWSMLSWPPSEGPPNNNRDV